MIVAEVSTQAFKGYPAFTPVACETVYAAQHKSLNRKSKSADTSVCHEQLGAIAVVVARAHQVGPSILKYIQQI